MAKARKVTGRKPKIKKSPPSKSIDDLVGYCEDGETIEISDKFLDYMFLLYGESGSGKTSTLSKCPGSYIIQCDPKRKGLKVRQTNVPDSSLEEIKRNRDEHTPWEVIEATFEKIIEDDSVRTVIIDNMRAFYDHASNHYCKRKMVDSLSDMNDYGVSWNNVDAMYLDWFSRIVNSGRGLGLIAHMREREITLPDNTTMVQIQPDLTGRAMTAVRSLTDFAFFLGYNSDGDRILTVRHPGNDVWYKCCTDEEFPRFFDPDGNPVHRIVAGKSPGECWANILKSWDNQLYDAEYQPPKERKVKIKRRTKS